MILTIKEKDINILQISDTQKQTWHSTVGIKMHAIQLSKAEGLRRWMKLTLILTREVTLKEVTQHL